MMKHHQELRFVLAAVVIAYTMLVGCALWDYLRVPKHKRRDRKVARKG